MDEKVEKHKSFGVIRFNRQSIGGKGIQLFGSGVNHTEVVTVALYPAKLERSLNNDYIYPDSGLPYIEATMSQQQFAEAITSMNKGSGTPITYRHINGEITEFPQVENRRILIEKEFEDKIRELSKGVSSIKQEAAEILDQKKPINKAEREKLKALMGNVQYKLDNLPFVLEQFNEQTEKIVQEAKMEIQASAQATIRDLGVEALSKSIKKMTPEELNNLRYQPNIVPISQLGEVKIDEEK